MKRNIVFAIAVLFGIYLIPGSSFAQTPTPTPTAADFPDSDVLVLALEISGELLPPPSLYERIHSDLIAIRNAYPETNEVHYYPSWEIGEIFADLTPEAMEQFKMGEYHGLDALNAVYGLPQITALEGSLCLQFSRPYNPAVLADLYSKADGVIRAYPDRIIRIGVSSDIRVALPHYTLTLGWGDCPAGCIYKHYWLFSVTDGSVTLIDEGGDQLTSGTPTPTPTATPLLNILLNNNSLRNNESLMIDIIVQPINQSFTAYGGIMLGDAFYSFTLGNYSELQKGIHPLAENVPGLKAAHATRLFFIQSIPSNIIPSGKAELRCSVVVGLVPSQMVPTGIESCIPGYVDRKEIAITK